MLPWDLREPGGVNQVVENLFDVAAPALGKSPLLLVNAWGVPRPERAVVDGRRTVRMTVRGPASERHSKRHLLAYLLLLPAALRRLRRLLIDESIMRVNVHYPSLDALTWLLAVRSLAVRPEVMLSFHGADLRDARAARGWRRWLWGRLLAGADDITVCSQSLRDALVAHFGTPPARVRVIANGVDPGRVQALASAPPSVALPPRFLLSLATIEHKKGLDTLIDAYARLMPAHPGLDLVIAGRVAEPAYEQALQAQVEALGLGARVRILRDLAHPDAMRVLARADALILASRQEPFGIVVLEAGVLGVPVVATSVCGAVQLLDPPRDLLSVSPDDAGGMATAIDGLLSGRVASAPMTASLRARVMAEFTWDRVGRHYERGAPLR